MVLGGSVVSAAAASSCSSDSSGSGTGATCGESSRLKSTRPSKGIHSSAVALPCSRATAQTAIPAAEAPRAA